MGRSADHTGMSLLSSRSIHCPACGGTNATDADRCRYCTRPLGASANDAEAAFHEHVFDRPVSRRRARQPLLGPRAWIAVLLVTLVGVNYFWLGYGPAWAHREQAGPPGSTWGVVTSPEGWRALLPGRPLQDRVVANDGSFERSWSEVDGDWRSTFDADNTSAGARLAADGVRHATVMVANGPGGGDPADLLVSLAGGASISDASIEPVSGRLGVVDVRARYRGLPVENEAGTVRARMTLAGSRVDVVAVFTRGGDDAALFRHLLDGFRPAGPSA